MSKHGLGSLADLAKIMEEAANPESEVREDRKESKPKTMARKGSAEKRARILDPKRKAWYERRLKEQAEKEQASASAPATPDTTARPAVTKAAATQLAGSLLETLAAANTAQAKAEKSKQRPEAWRRKPGDPIF